MAFTPASPLNLVFKKYTAIPAPQLVTVPVPSGTSFISPQNLPSWLKVVNPSIQSGDIGRFYFEVSEGGANNFEPGNHSATVSFIAVSYDGGGNTVTALGDYVVHIEIIDTVVLALSPSILNFSYTTGSAVPATRPVQITSENNWNISTEDSWITLSAGSGSQNATVQIGIDPATLDPGNYSGTVTVNDVNFIRTIAVNLTISEPVTELDYLYVNPSNIEFLSEQGEVNGNNKTLVIDAGASWDAQVSESWLNLAATNGAQGITDLDVSVDSAALNVGVYQAEISFNANGVIKKAFVTLRVVQFSISGFDNNGLYYAEDRNKLVVENVNDNSFLLLQIEATSQSRSENYQLSQPYFKGVASALVGEEVDYLIPSIEPSVSTADRIFNLIRPVTLKINAFEESKFIGLTTTLGTYSNLRFLKGKTPAVAGKACYIPDTVYVSNKARLHFTIVAETAPANATITGAINSVINSGLPNDLYLYTLHLDLSAHDLQSGNKVFISFGGQNWTVIINNDYTESNLLAFENEWGVHELFETRGFIRKVPKVNPLYGTVSTEGKAHTRVIEADEDEEFELNTGYVVTGDEIVWLTRMLNSKRVFLFEDGFPLEVIFTTKKLQKYATREHVNAFRLQFKKAVV